jgi:hypothetical protein
VLSLFDGLEGASKIIFFGETFRGLPTGESEICDGSGEDNFLAGFSNAASSPFSILSIFERRWNSRAASSSCIELPVAGGSPSGLRCGDFEKF